MWPHRNNSRKNVNMSIQVPSTIGPPKALPMPLTLESPPKIVTSAVDFVITTLDPDWVANPHLCRSIEVEQEGAPTLGELSNSPARTRQLPQVPIRGRLGAVLGRFFCIRICCFFFHRSIISGDLDDCETGKQGAWCYFLYWISCFSRDALMPVIMPAGLARYGTSRNGGSG